MSSIHRDTGFTSRYQTAESFFRLHAPRVRDHPDQIRRSHTENARGLFTA
jgi:hypothetical protein